MTLSVDTSQLWAKYQHNNSWGNNLRVGENHGIQGGDGSEEAYQPVESVNYNVAYKPPVIDEGTTIHGLKGSGRANDTGKLTPYFA